VVQPLVECGAVEGSDNSSWTNCTIY